MIELGDVTITDPTTATTLINKLKRGETLSPDLVKELCSNLLVYSIDAIAPAKLLSIMTKVIQYLDSQQLILLSQHLIFNQGWMADLKKAYKLATGVALAILKLNHADYSVWTEFVQNSKSVENIYARSSSQKVKEYQDYIKALLDHQQRSFPAICQALNDGKINLTGLVEATITDSRVLEELVNNMRLLNPNDLNRVYWSLLYNLSIQSSPTPEQEELVCRMVWIYSSRRLEYRSLFRNAYLKLPASVLSALYSQNPSALSNEERVAILSAPRCPLAFFECEIDLNKNPQLVEYCIKRLSDPEFNGVCWAFV